MSKKRKGRKNIIVQRTLFVIHCPETALIPSPLKRERQTLSDKLDYMSRLIAQIFASIEMYSNEITKRLSVQITNELND